MLSAHNQSSITIHSKNDCTPRIVEVTKKEVARMIFSDPWEMKIENGNRAKD